MGAAPRHSTLLKAPQLLKEEEGGKEVEGVWGHWVWGVLVPLPVTLCGHWSPGGDIPSFSVSIPWDREMTPVHLGLPSLHPHNSSVPLLPQLLTLAALQLCDGAHFQPPNHFYASCAPALLFSAHLSPDVVSAAS